MASKETLSADLDLVKEVEQLRIKQKLLIDALGRKKKEEQDQQLADLSSKIDFLVEIFKNASKEEEQQGEDNQASLVEKIDEVISKVDERFEKLDERISSIEKKVTQPQQTPPVPEFHNQNNEGAKKDSEKKEEGAQQQPQNKEEEKASKKKKGLFSK